MEAEFIDVLLADAPITAVVGTRIFPQRRLQGSVFPAITVFRTSGAPLYVDEGEAGLEQGLFQVECWGETYNSAKSLARLVVNLLHQYSGVDFSLIMLDEERDLTETGSNMTEYPFRVILDFIVWKRG